jgi:hypothetical protein
VGTGGLKKSAKVSVRITGIRAEILNPEILNGSRNANHYVRPFCLLLPLKWNEAFSEKHEAFKTP